MEWRKGGRNITALFSLAITVKARPLSNYKQAVRFDRGICVRLNADRDSQLASG